MATQHDTYGRGGPYPADSERFDPLNGSPPGRWELVTHDVGGNGDLGTRRERAVWERRDTGATVIVELEGSDDQYTVTVERTEEGTSIYPPEGRESAFDRAGQIMENDPGVTVDPSLTVGGTPHELPAGIGEFTVEADGHYTISWENAEGWTLRLSRPRRPSAVGVKVGLESPTEDYSGAERETFREVTEAVDQLVEFAKEAERGERSA